MPCLPPEARDFRVRLRINLVQFALRSVNYAGDRADNPRHRVIDVGLLDHRHRLPQTHFMHSVDRSARIVSGQTIGQLTNCRGVLLECGTFLRKSVADFRPGVR
jgi:hypothetical protein